MSNAYDKYKEAVTDGQKDKSFDEVKDDMEKRSTYTVSLDELTKQTHVWVDRGAVMSCEGAGHPYHQAFKRR